jgi:peptide/nickel transport system substrate-binding protein
VSSDGEETRREATLSRRRLLESGLAAGVAISAAGPFAGIARAVKPSPRRGGKFRVGLVGGGSKELLDAHQALNEMDIARVHVIYENLTDYAPNGAIYDRLAADFAADKTATVWTIKLRDDVLWHDGSRFTADDVVYSLRRITTPKLKLQGLNDLPFLRPNHVQKVDRSTVRLTLDSPIAGLRANLASRALPMIKNGTTNFDHPVGTGPFKFVSWKRGQRTLLDAWRSYRVHGGPYVDQLELIEISETTARLNALRAGQIDAMGQLDGNLVPVVKGDKKLRVLESPTGGFVCQYMQVTTKPFDDKRVREAFRLLTDRKQIVQNALLRHGIVGNDLACPFDPDYAKSIPQRPYDPEKARSLLKAAGQEGLTVSLATSDVAPGVLSSSTLLVQHAKEAGLTISLDKTPADSYWTDKYLKTAFACTEWGQKPLDSWILQAVDSKAPYNETVWKRSSFDKLTRQARRTLDDSKRRALYVEAQRMLWNEGGYIIWGFPDLIDAYSAKVHGLKVSSARTLGYYDFNDVYLA